MATDPAEDNVEEALAQDPAVDDHRIERTDVGVSITAKITRGTGTRDQEEFRLKAKRRTVEAAHDDLDAMVAKITGETGAQLRDWEPAQDGGDDA